MRRRSLASLTAAGVLVVAMVTPASAQQLTWQVIATGLDNPRGVGVSTNDAVYVAESGEGGTDTCIDLGPEFGVNCFGVTGAVTEIHRGTQHRILTGFPSGAAEDGTHATGPSDVFVRGNNEMLVTIGLGGDPELRDGLPADFHALGWLAEGGRNGHVHLEADVVAFEAANDPDADQPGSEGVNSNPNAVVAAPHGGVVADAGGNSLVFAGRDGSTSLVAEFAFGSAPAPDFLGLPPGTMIPVQPVPTSVAIGPDGAYYVGLLTGFPFVVGAATVMRVVPGEAPTVYASGFTNVMDVAFAADGSLWVLEIATNGLLSGDATGGLWHVPPGGGTGALVMTEPLNMPGGLAVHDDGSLVISNCSVCANEGTVIQVWP